MKAIKLFKIINSADTVYIEGFYVENSGKLYRACGNCKSGYQNQRKVELKNVTAKDCKIPVGININYGDTAKFEGVTYFGGMLAKNFKALH